MRFLLLFLSFSAWAEASRVEFRGSEYRVYTVDLKQADLRLYWKKADGTAYENLSAVREALGPKFLMATNSGIYTREFTPLGLHVERGVQLQKLNRSKASKGNFFIQPNGVFMILAGAARILETSESIKLRPMEASQSGPLLLYRGAINSHFSDGSENRKLRSGVGVNALGQAVFAISVGAVSFYDFALLFKEKLACMDALYLDGTISTMLESDAQPDVQIAPYVGIWAASLRTPSPSGLK